MSDLITAQVKRIIGNALTGYAEDITLTYQNVFTDDDYGGRTATTGTEAGRGFMDTFTNADRIAANVPLTSRKIIILANTIARQPAVGDEITMRGETMEVIQVDKDPAQATYEVIVK